MFCKNGHLRLSGRVYLLAELTYDLLERFILSAQTAYAKL